MPIRFSVGQAFSVEGRDAVARAAYEARLPVGNARVAFAIIIASVEYDFQAVFNSAKTQIGDVPMIGFSTTGELTHTGCHRRSVVVGLMVDDGLRSTSGWLPDFSENSVATMRTLLGDLALTSEHKGLLMLVADGLSGDYEEMVHHMPPGRYQFAGCLASGDLRLGVTHQCGGNRAGKGGLAGAFLAGENLRVGVGTAHGWRPVGARFEVTGVSGQWLRELDSQPATERYATLFGRESKDWTVPPLNTLVRLYPLGMMQADRQMVLRAPLKVELDGSLRMSSTLTEGGIGQLLVGSREKCLQAAREASQAALEELGDHPPRFGIVFADISWQMLFQGYEGAEMQVIRQVVGEEVLLVGGYTFGQFRHTSGAPRPEFLNQHIEIILFG